MTAQKQPRPSPGPTPEPIEIARACARIADEKKGDDILLLDVQPTLVITSYFVLVTGDTGKQLQAMADAIHEHLKPLGVKRYGREGYEEGRWVLLDYGEVVVHLFARELRGYYNLETIWDDAPRVPWDGAKPRPQPAPPKPRARDEEE